MQAGTNSPGPGARASLFCRCSQDAAPYIGSVCSKPGKSGRPLLRCTHMHRGRRRASRGRRSVAATARAEKWARCEIAFSKMISNILAGEDTNFCVFSRYLSLLERGLLQKAHFTTDPSRFAPHAPFFCADRCLQSIHTKSPAVGGPVSSRWAI